MFPEAFWKETSRMKWLNETIFRNSFSTMLAQYSISIPPESEPLIFWRFQGIWKWNIGRKWVKSLRNCFGFYNKKIYQQNINAFPASHFEFLLKSTPKEIVAKDR